MNNQVDCKAVARDVALAIVAGRKHEAITILEDGGVWIPSTWAPTPPGFTGQVPKRTHEGRQKRFQTALYPRLISNGYEHRRSGRKMAWFEGEPEYCGDLNWTKPSFCYCEHFHETEPLGHEDGHWVEYPCGECDCDPANVQAENIKHIMDSWKAHEKKYGHKHENMRELDQCPEGK